MAATFTNRHSFPRIFGRGFPEVVAQGADTSEGIRTARSSLPLRRHRRGRHLPIDQVET